MKSLVAIIRRLLVVNLMAAFSLLPVAANATILCIGDDGHIALEHRFTSDCAKPLPKDAGEEHASSSDSPGESQCGPCVDLEQEPSIERLKHSELAPLSITRLYYSVPHKLIVFERYRAYSDFSRLVAPPQQLLASVVLLV